LSQGGRAMSPLNHRLIILTLSLVFAVVFAGLAGCPHEGQMTVPSLFEMTETQAIVSLGLVGMELGAITPVNSDTVPAGLIVGQFPETGTMVAQGTLVDVVLSLGPSSGEGEGEGEREQLTVLLPGDVPLELVQIPAGSFTMGSPSSELGRMFDESPQHLVTIAQPFWLGRTEITKAQWEALMGAAPWDGRQNVITDPDSPAVFISWDDTQEFIAALNDYTGETFRLPSESEWEYAARAASGNRFYWGADNDYTQTGNYAWWDENADFAGENYAHIVAQKLPNNWGLYDTSGNVYEWCQDWYHSSYQDAPDDGSAWEFPLGAMRIRRGGSYASPGQYCRCAYRSLATPNTASDAVGFRIALD